MSNTKWRKKPVVIEARQWQGKGAEAFLHWIGGPSFQCGSTLIIPTLEGDHEASLGDWIIKGVKGEFYPCKPDIFEATYEPATIPQQDNDDVEKVAHAICEDIKRQFNGHPIPGVPASANSWTAVGGTLECSELARAAIAVLRPADGVLRREELIAWLDALLGYCGEHPKELDEIHAMLRACDATELLRQALDVLEGRETYTKAEVITAIRAHLETA